MTKLKKLFAVAALIFFCAATASVQFTDEPKYEVHVERYKVRSGDTLWDVSRYYRDLDDRNLYIFDYQDELRRLNPQLVKNKNQLMPNDVITVKYLKIKEKKMSCKQDGIKSQKYYITFQNRKQ